MRTQDETRRVAEGFFKAWTTGNAGAARALMADDMEYSGPLNTYHTADALLGPLMKFATLVKGVRIIELLVEGDRAALMYDCHLPAPVGTLRTASFQHVKNGRIQTYLQAFDATELGKLLGRKS